MKSWCGERITYSLMIVKALYCCSHMNKCVGFALTHCCVTETPRKWVSVNERDEFLLRDTSNWTPICEIRCFKNHVGVRGGVWGGELKNRNWKGGANYAKAFNRARVWGGTLQSNVSWLDRVGQIRFENTFFFPIRGLARRGERYCSRTRTSRGGFERSIQKKKPKIG